MNKQLQDGIKYLTPEEVEDMGIKLKPARPRRYKLEDEMEYDSIEELVSMAVQYGIIPKEKREDIVIYLKAIYKNGVFSDPTDVAPDPCNGFRIPYTIKALKGLLRQRGKMIACKKAPSSPIPQELQTEKGQEILNKAINKGLLIIDAGGHFCWNKTAALYGYFIDTVSDKMDMRPSNNNICWKKFAFIKNHDRLLITAKSKVNRYKNEREQVPEGDDLVNDLFR